MIEDLSHHLMVSNKFRSSDTTRGSHHFRGRWEKGERKAWLEEEQSGWSDPPHRFVSPKFLAADAMGATKHGEPRLFKCWEMLEGQHRPTWICVFILYIRINVCLYIYRICNCYNYILPYIYTHVHTPGLLKVIFRFPIRYIIYWDSDMKSRGAGDWATRASNVLRAAHVDVYLCANVPNNFSSLKRYMEVAKVIAEFHWMICREYLRTISQHGRLMKTHPVIRKKQLAGRAFFFLMNMV